MSSCQGWVAGWAWLRGRGKAAVNVLAEAGVVVEVRTRPRAGRSSGARRLLSWLHSNGSEASRC